MPFHRGVATLKIMTKRPLSEVQNDLTLEELEQYITELEISDIEKDQELTDQEIAILELQQRLDKEG
jgi:hypothetical protein